MAAAEYKPLILLCWCERLVGLECGHPYEPWALFESLRGVGAAAMGGGHEGVGVGHVRDGGVGGGRKRRGSSGT